MKKIFILIIVLAGIFSIGCKRGYNCKNGTCTSASGGQYNSLEDCKSDCGDGSGSVTINVSWSYNSCYKVDVGIAYTSTDLANEAYINTGEWLSPPASYFKDGLLPGTYYYKISKIGSCSYAPSSDKSGTFVIKNGQGTSVAESI